MSDSETGQIPWKRIFVEVIAIVGSILIAFALDAWWDGRSDRVQEVALLTALEEDFAVADSSFEVTKAGHLAEVQSSKELIDYGESGQIPVDQRARIDTLVSTQFSRRNFDPPMGTVQSVLGSGRIDLITNQDLITELTRWSSVVEALQRMETDSRRHFNEYVFPFLAARLDVEDLDKGFPAFVDYPWEQAPAGAYRIVLDQEFQNLIYMRWVLLQNIVTEALPPVEDGLTRIQALLVEELADR